MNNDLISILRSEREGGRFKNNDLISRVALKEALKNEIGEHALSIAIDRVIDNVPTVISPK